MMFEEEFEHIMNKLAEKLLDTLLPSDPGGYSKGNLRIIKKISNITVTDESGKKTEK